MFRLNAWPPLITSWVFLGGFFLHRASGAGGGGLGVGVPPLHSTDCSIDSQEMAQLWITIQAKHVRHAARETNKTVIRSCSLNLPEPEPWSTGEMLSADS